MNRADLVLGVTVGAACALSAQWIINRLKVQRKLTDFQPLRVLKVTETEIAVVGAFTRDPAARPAVLLIQKAPLDPSDLSVLLQSLSLHQIMNNDIYSTFHGDVAREYKPFKVNLIYPATQTHIQKHSEQKFHMITETKELYEQVTLPHIESIPASKIDWVYNILDHKKEVDRIIFENPDPTTGFMLLPDFKWNDTSNIESLYCLAIVNDRSIRSLRDLNGSHVKLLETIRDQSLRALAKSFHVLKTSLRVYVHYQPTYYHFHVHLSHVKILHGVQTGKAVLLEDIINNLKNDGAHYTKATLSYTIGEMQHQPLFAAFQARGLLP